MENVANESTSGVMPIPETVGAFAIVPHNELSAAIPFWERLGFARAGGDSAYVIMTGWGCEVHLTQAGSGPWRVPEEHNPFGLFIRTPEVDAIAARVAFSVTVNGASMRWVSVAQTVCSSALVGLPG